MSTITILRSAMHKSFLWACFLRSYSSQSLRAKSNAAIDVHTMAQIKSRDCVLVIPTESEQVFVYMSIEFVLLFQFRQNTANACECLWHLGFPYLRGKALAFCMDVSFDFLLGNLGQRSDHKAGAIILENMVPNAVVKETHPRSLLWK